MKKALPVLLLTGYLGSGKTTLLNRILSNRRGIRFAVIVNDIGEINIDAELIAKGGIVGGDKQDDLVALQNGCICCSLKDDLLDQLDQLAAADCFDYIVIEASGICEPAPIAQTVCAVDAFGDNYPHAMLPRMDAIVTVVDALRLKDEFGMGEALTTETRQDDIESLVIDQIEFCNIVLLNKIDLVSKEEAEQIRTVVRALQPRAEIIDCSYCDVPLEKLLYTDLFDFEDVATSAAWVQGVEQEMHDGYEHEHHHHEHGEHCHCCDCQHDKDPNHVSIDTMIYYRRRGFDLNKFDYFVAKEWPKNIIRTKGVVYFRESDDMSYLFEQAGTQKKLTQAGLWLATAPEEERRAMIEQDPTLARDWSEKYGDRMIKLVIIGRNLDRREIERLLDKCL